MKILVIAQKVEAIARACQDLEAAGHTCIVVPDHAAAEQLQQTNHFDLEMSLHVPGATREPAHVLEMDDLRMDLDTHQVTRGGKLVQLQPLEYQLLEYMMRHPGRVLTRSVILSRVWNYTIEPLTNVVESCVSRLRSKVDSLSDSKLIKTIKGFGYKLGR